MALPVNRPLKEWNLDTPFANITTSGATAVCFTPVPFIGVVTRVYGAQYAVVSGGASIVSAAVNGGTPFATMTFTSGTAAGQVVTQFWAPIRWFRPRVFLWSKVTSLASARTADQPMEPWHARSRRS